MLPSTFLLAKFHIMGTSKSKMKTFCLKFSIFQEKKITNFWILVGGKCHYVLVELSIWGNYLLSILFLGGFQLVMFGQYLTNSSLVNAKPFMGSLSM